MSKPGATGRKWSKVPELPEVETIKNELLPYVKDRTITDVNLIWEGVVRGITPDEFRRRLIGQKIISLGRRGKYLIFNLSGGEKMVSHLKLTGALLVKQADCEPERFVRAIICLDNGMNLQLRDPRKFARLWLTSDPAIVTGKLGPEPLTDEFSSKWLRDHLNNRGTLIKPLLLDQKFIAGIGNMYADEALFEANIHPARPTASLKPEEITRLYHAIIKVLKKALGEKGASVQNYLRPSGEKGTAHLEFNVAHRRGESCPVCGTPLGYMKLRGRGTYFCPHCQPEKPQK
jgi:formamidopyrimidine-DNA glycosylase